MPSKWLCIFNSKAHNIAQACLEDSKVNSVSKSNSLLVSLPARGHIWKISHKLDSQSWKPDQLAKASSMHQTFNKGALHRKFSPRGVKVFIASKADCAKTETGLKMPETTHIRASSLKRSLFSHPTARKTWFSPNPLNHGTSHTACLIQGKRIN